MAVKLETIGGGEHEGPTVAETVQRVWGEHARLGAPDQWGHRVVTRPAHANPGVREVLDKVKAIHGSDNDVDGTLLGQIRDAADAVRAAEQTVADRREVLDALLSRAGDLGVPIVTLAREAGLSRSAVYTSIERATKRGAAG